MEKRGIDISHHQGDIDFDKLKGNIDFAMVRTSYGSFYEDKKYKQNILGLERVKIPYGLYHFSYATSVDYAKKEEEGFINIIKKYNPTYPVVIDIEASDRTSNVRGDTLVDIADTICRKIEEAGYYAMIYANLDYLNNKLNDSRLDKYDKWLAEWKSKPTYNKNFGIWQYSSKGSIPGINGNVDLNISYKDYPSIIKNVKEEEKSTDNNMLNDVNYVVKKGDNLYAIARTYNTTVDAIKRLNNLTSNNLDVGMILKIPGKTSLTDVTKIYIVKKGDSLYSIARAYNTTVADLKKINNLSSNLLSIGQKIKISN